MVSGLTHQLIAPLKSAQDAAVTDDAAVKPESLMAKADHALYQAKEQGRNRYVVAEKC